MDCGLVMQTALIKFTWMNCWLTRIYSTDKIYLDGLWVSHVSSNNKNTNTIYLDGLWVGQVHGTDKIHPDGLQASHEYTPDKIYLDGLRVIDVYAQVHQDLRDKVWHVVGMRLNAGAQSQHASMPLDQLLQGVGLSGSLALLQFYTPQVLKVTLQNMSNILFGERLKTAPSYMHY